MKLSKMLADKSVAPMQIVEHKDFSRAAWTARANGVVTPIDAILRGERVAVAQDYAKLGF